MLLPSAELCVLVCPHLAPLAGRGCHCRPRGPEAPGGTRQAACNRRWLRTQEKGQQQMAGGGPQTRTWTGQEKGWQQMAGEGAADSDRRRAGSRWLERGHRLGRGRAGVPSPEGRPGPDDPPPSPGHLCLTSRQSMEDAWARGAGHRLGPGPRPRSPHCPEKPKVISGFG